MWDSSCSCQIVSQEVRLMLKWFRENWLVTAIIGAITYCIHLVIEYVVVDSVLKLAGVSFSIL